MVETEPAEFGLKKRQTGQKEEHMSQEDTSELNKTVFTKESTEKERIISTETNGSTSDRKQLQCVYVPKRYIITFMTGLGMLLTYAMRTNVGVTVVTILDERAREKVGTSEAAVNLPHNQWDSLMIGFLHSVFYIGHFISQIPGAFLITIWPSHKVFGLCIVMSALLNLLLPVSISRLGYFVTCTLRCCQGLSEGLLYPACYGVLRHWSAPKERSRQVSTVLTSAYAGAILGFPVAGLTTYYFGWQYVYYLCGVACILWYITWMVTSYEKPSHHKYINDDEFEYLEKAQGQDVIDYENMQTPWKDILTSFPVYSICVCHFARHWVFTLMLTNEPLYLNMFNFSMAETGVFSSFPHIAKVVMAFASGYIADTLMNRQLLSRMAVRKLLTCLGFGFQGLCFVVLTFLTNGQAVLTVLTLALAWFGLSTSGWQVNHYDLSTRHASALVAVTSTFGTLGAIMVPLAVGDLTQNKDLAGWNHVFYLSATIVFVAVIFFFIFGSGDQQSWANPPADIQLIQKTDPLARKPYRIVQLQQPTEGQLQQPTEQTTEGQQKEATELTPVTTHTSPDYGLNTKTDSLRQSLIKQLDPISN